MNSCPMETELYAGSGGHVVVVSSPPATTIILYDHARFYRSIDVQFPTVRRNYLYSLAD